MTIGMREGLGVAKDDSHAQSGVLAWPREMSTLGGRQGRGKCSWRSHRLVGVTHWNLRSAP